MSKKTGEGNPYAKNEPKTPEEEEYYRDVYSGNWSEGSDNGLQSVYKHSASTSLPPHWQAMPPGARTLDEIRFEASQRQMAEARVAERSLPPSSSQTAPGASFQSYPNEPYAATMTAPAPAPSETLPAYGAQATYAPAVQGAPAPTTAAGVSPFAPTSAPLTQPFAAAPTGAPTNAYAQYGPVTSPAQNSAVPVQVAATTGQNVQYVAQVPAQPQAVSPTPAAYSSAGPAVQTPAVQTPVVPNPASAPAVYPTTPAATNFGAFYSVPTEFGEESILRDHVLNHGANWIVRGQEADEDDPFAADEADDDPFADESDSATDEEEEESEVAADEDTETEETPAVEVTRENVNVKSVAPAATVSASAAPAVAGPAPAENSNPVASAVRPGNQKLPLQIDPSIAEPYAKVNRPTNNPSAPAKTDSARVTYDEYVVTGGDAKAPVISHKDWSVDNLDPEDSVAHFDTVDGRILTEPTNRIFLYSPRFGAVRQVVGPIEGDYREGVGIANMTDVAVQNDQIEGVDVRTQEIRPLGANNALQPQGAETTVGVTIHTGLMGVMEGDAQIRLGAMLTSETVDDLSAQDASLMLDGAIAAQGWSGEQGVAVSTELVNAFSNAYIDGPATIYQIKDDTKTSKLRVIKIANKDSAKPGELVEFTLRFENIGEEPIGNVTILDNLSSRLRYVDGTAQSSVKADFLADLNEKGSLVLRWEIDKPLMPKDYGVIRFICKVQ